jgi:hypothetical protein
VSFPIDDAAVHQPPTGRLEDRPGMKVELAFGLLLKICSRGYEGF